MRFIKFRPSHWLYIVLHAVMVLVGILLCAFKPETAWFAIGGSLAATGFAGWVIFLYVAVADEYAVTLRTPDLLT